MRSSCHRGECAPSFGMQDLLRCRSGIGSFSLVFYHFFGFWSYACRIYRWEHNIVSRGWHRRLTEIVVTQIIGYQVPSNRINWSTMPEAAHSRFECRGFINSLVVYIFASSMGIRDHLIIFDRNGYRRVRRYGVGFKDTNFTVAVCRPPISTDYDFVLSSRKVDSGLA